MRTQAMVLGVLIGISACEAKPKPATSSVPAPRPPASAPASRPPSRPPESKSAALEMKRLTIKSGLQRAEVQTGEADAQWGTTSATSWSVRGADGVWTRVVEIPLGRRARRTLDGYLAAWRKSHGCTANERKDLPLLKNGGQAPPQLTFSGSCKGGDAYLQRVIILDSYAYELHADSQLSIRKRSEVEPALRALLAKVELR